MAKIGSSDIAYHYIGSSLVPRVYECEDTVDTPYTSFSADVLIIGGGGGGGKDLLVVLEVVLVDIENSQRNIILAQAIL